MREREVMQHVVKGLLNEQIAAELGTSEVTVRRLPTLYPVKPSALSEGYALSPDKNKGKTCLRRF
jgi:transposase